MSRGKTIFLCLLEASGLCLLGCQETQISLWCGNKTLVLIVWSTIVFFWGGGGGGYSYVCGVGNQCCIFRGVGPHSSFCGDVWPHGCVYTKLTQIVPFRILVRGIYKLI